MKHTIQQRYESYLTTLYPHGCPEPQAKEVKQAFYGGAMSVLSLLNKIADESEDAGVGMIDALHDEVRAYVMEKIKK